MRAPVASAARAERTVPAAGVANQLAALGEFVDASFRFWRDVEDGGRAQGLNVFREPAALTNIGAAAENVSVWGSWQLDPDEALLIEVEPPDALYWSAALGNYWWETIDYANHQSSLNGFQAVLDDDGVFRAVVSARDPGVANWLDTAGHGRGPMIFRWLRAGSHPVPATRVVPLARGSSTNLPAGTARVTPRSAEGHRRAARGGEAPVRRAEQEKHMDLGFKGATAAVTGGTKGMGRAIVEILAEGAQRRGPRRGQAAIDETVASLEQQGRQVDRIVGRRARARSDRSCVRGDRRRVGITEHPRQHDRAGGGEVREPDRRGLAHCVRARDDGRRAVRARPPCRFCAGRSGPASSTSRRTRYSDRARSSPRTRRRRRRSRACPRTWRSRWRPRGSSSTP